MIILKFSLENTVLENHTRVKLTPLPIFTSLPCFFRVKSENKMLVKQAYFQKQ